MHPLGDILGGLDELVDAISLGEEDEELSSGVIAAAGEFEDWFCC